MDRPGVTRTTKCSRASTDWTPRRVVDRLGLERIMEMFSSRRRTTVV
jgi:hypothetical protein